ncbi:MAG: hypothetical protein K6F86_02160 [Lachnospiraceae bacterium]|nr:hypothetical protein [Lachnospiraceae bacterium]
MKVNAKTGSVLGLISFISYALSFLIGYDDESGNSFLILVKAGLILVSALLFVISSYCKMSEKLKAEYSVLCILILVYQMVLVFCVGRTIVSIRYYSAVLNSLCWIFAAIYVFLRFRGSLLKWFNGLIRDRETLFLAAAAFLLSAFVITLSAEPEGVRFTWDSDTLYGSVYAMDYRSLYDVKLTTFHSHVSAVYIHIITLLKLLTGDIRTAFFILNSLCIAAASFGMIFLQRKLVPGRKKAEYILAGALFVLSPWVCGLSTYHIYDYYIWCLFPLLICFCCVNNWIGFLIVGIMITFSKASGLIVFGSVCFGVVFVSVIFDIKQNGIRSFNRIFLRLVSDVKNWFFASVAMIFFVFFKLGIDRGTQFEDTRFGLDISHIKHVLKLYLTANYLWVFCILTVLIIISLFVLKNDNFGELTKKTVGIVLISDLIFIFFNCLCITYRLPRYMDSHIAVLYICGSLMLLSINRRKFADALTVVICLAAFISSFRMADPVTMMLFKKFDAGKRNIVDFEKTNTPSIGDSIICNREYYSYEVLLGKVLSYVISDRSDEDGILFSLGHEEITWGLSGGRYSYSYSENKSYFELFYDTKINGLANGLPGYNMGDPDMIPFEMRYIFPEESLEDALAPGLTGCFYYIYLPSVNESKEQKIYDDHTVIDEKQFVYRGWQMNCIKFM